MTDLEIKKVECLKQFNTLFEFTGNITDVIPVTVDIYNLFSSYFEDDETIHTQSPFVKTAACLEKFLVWLHVLGLKRSRHGPYGDYALGYICNYKKIEPPKVDSTVFDSLSSLSCKKEECLKKFNSMFMYTNDKNDKIRITNDIYELFKSYFEDDEYIRFFQPLLKTLSEDKKLVVWIGILELDKLYIDDHPYGWLCKYKKIAPTSDETSFPNNIEGFSEIIKKFNSFYVYTGVSTDLVELHNIQFNMRFESPIDDLAIRNWLINMNIDNDPHIEYKTIIIDGKQKNISLLTKYKSARPLLRRETH